MITRVPEAEAETEAEPASTSIESEAYATREEAGTQCCFLPRASRISVLC